MGTSMANAITVDIHGTVYNTANSSTTYDFVYPSSGSWDSGINKINIVDYILSGRLSSGNHIHPVKRKYVKSFLKLGLPTER